MSSASKTLSGCSGLLFTLAGLILLIVKLTTAATFSWWWVFGVMFFPLWVVLAIIVTILGICLAIVAIALAAAIICLPFWLGYHAWESWKLARTVAKQDKANKERLAKLRQELNDKR
jgi:uncharacterized membrane protein